MGTGCSCTVWERSGKKNDLKLSSFLASLSRRAWEMGRPSGPYRLKEQELSPAHRPVWGPGAKVTLIPLEHPVVIPASTQQVCSPRVDLGILPTLPHGSPLSPVCRWKLGQSLPMPWEAVPECPLLSCPFSYIKPLGLPYLLLFLYYTLHS